MAIPQDRLSTSPVYEDFLPPDERHRAWTEDYEYGPVALNDPSLGLAHQVWHLTWVAGDFIVTPETTGSPSTVLSAANVTQCSLAFDQNGHVNLAYTVNWLTAYLYWYDTNIASWTVSTLATGATTPMICLDDKRTTQTQSSDVMLYYTKKQLDDSWNLYKLEQRERYLQEQLMKTGVFPYIHKLGMHYGLRNQIALRPNL